MRLSKSIARLPSRGPYSLEYKSVHASASHKLVTRIAYSFLRSLETQLGAGRTSDNAKLSQSAWDLAPAPGHNLRCYQWLFLRRARKGVQRSGAKNKPMKADCGNTVALSP